MGILDVIEPGPNEFGHDKDGNFEGYAFRDKLNDEMMKAIEIIENNTDVGPDMRAESVLGLRALSHGLKKLTNHSITREKLEEYRRAGKMLLEKGTIKDRKKEIGGLVGFILKLFR